MYYMYIHFMSKLTRLVVFVQSYFIIPSHKQKYHIIMLSKTTLFYSNVKYCFKVKDSEIFAVFIIEINLLIPQYFLYA